MTMQPGSPRVGSRSESNSLRRESTWPGLASKRTKVWKDKARRPLHLPLYAAALCCAFRFCPDHGESGAIEGLQELGRRRGTLSGLLAEKALQVSVFEEDGLHQNCSRC